ncbi:MAG: hypothetical protein ABIR98_14325 [Usitatibacter sp.]
MEDKNVEALAAEVVSRLARARIDLAAKMHDLGLGIGNGWRVIEELRHTVEGTEWTLRPVHLREPSPPLEVKVAIDHDGRPL